MFVAFNRARNFNQDIGKWNTGKVENMQSSKWKYKETIIAKIPSNRLGKPEDIANAVLFLSSDQSDYIYGETLHVNGGMYLGWQNYFLIY